MGRIEHLKTDDDSFVLLKSQTIKSVDEDRSTPCPLRSGKATFHLSCKYRDFGRQHSLDSSKNKVSVRLKLEACQMASPLVILCDIIHKHWHHN